MPYCEGFAIEILESDSKLGTDWVGIYGTREFKNSIVASIDSTINVPTSLLTSDSIFYFKYEDGGYAQKLYKVCLPAPSITISYISMDFCENEIVE